MQGTFPVLLLDFALSLVLTLILMPKLIAFLHKISYNQTVSEYSLEQYKAKAKTPTMGGTLFVVVPVAVTLILFPEIFISKEYIISLLSLLQGTLTLNVEF